MEKKIIEQERMMKKKEEKKTFHIKVDNVLLLSIENGKEWKPSEINSIITNRIHTEGQIESLYTLIKEGKGNK